MWCVEMLPIFVPPFQGLSDGCDITQGVALVPALG
jgi:hypothetical protein